MMLANERDIQYGSNYLDAHEISIDKWSLQGQKSLLCSTITIWNLLKYLTSENEDNSLYLYLHFKRD